ncbi:MAG: glycoside hydrolase family 3 C-terminal domain-containing protein, partial [Bifidobacterium mongoliense]
VAGYRQGYERRGAPNTVLLDDAVALAVDKGTDVVVVVIGLDERSESEGLDRSTMAIPQPQVDLIGALHATGKPIVAVLVAGSLVQTSWIDDADAVLYVGLSGQAGASAAVRILTGEVNPSGRLAETWPIDYADCPSAAWYPADGPDAIYREEPFVGYRYYRTADIPVRFPFGYGLSYASFSFGALSVNDDGVLFTVMNTSDVEGATVAQLYVRGPQGGVLRPDRELKGFIKVRLAAHERRVVHIDFDQYTFRHYDPTVQRLCTESGSWTVMVGEDCDHDRLRAQFTVEGDVEPVRADPALGAYLTGRVKDATDDELATLFRGHVPLTSPSSVFGVNDPIVSWQHSRGLVARAVARTLVRREARISRKKGAPDLDTLFVLNMPPRAMSKMTGGLVDGAMVDAIVLVANGHAVRGLGAFVVAYLRNRSAARNIAKELHHD